MIKNLDEVKKQLAELSDAVNRFKSEQVQLKIVELIFRGAGAEEEHAEDHSNLPPKKRVRRNKDKELLPRRRQRAPKSAQPGTGPMPTLEQFIQDGFFNQKRTIGAAVDHCKTKARNFKSNELSGPLGRLVRNNKLSRTKNSDGQWEYAKK
jgi:hypothetical protein